jgi:transcriptional regulator with XRE-family HTH domain
MTTIPRMKTDDDESLATRIRDARKALGLSQSGLAALAGIQSQTISLYERGGISNLKMETMTALAKALGRSVEWLVTGVEPASMEDDLPLTESGRTTSLQRFLDSLDPDDRDQPTAEELRWLEGLSFREFVASGGIVSPEMYRRQLRDRRGREVGKLKVGPAIEPPPARPGRVPVKGARKR